MIPGREFWEEQEIQDVIQSYLEDDFSFTLEVLAHNEDFQEAVRRLMAKDMDLSMIVNAQAKIMAHNRIEDKL